MNVTLLLRKVLFLSFKTPRHKILLEYSREQEGPGQPKDTPARLPTLRVATAAEVKRVLLDLFTRLVIDKVLLQARGQ